MTAPLVSRSTGDIIPASDHNDILPYIENGTYRVNTSSLYINGAEIINTSGDMDAVHVKLADSGDYFTGITAESVFAEIGETEFTNGYDLENSDSLPDLSFDNVTRVFTTSVKSGSNNYYFWCDGKKIIKTDNSTVTIPDVSGTYYIYFDNSGVLQYILASNINNAQFYENAITGLVYWNKTAGVGMVGRETHGIRMSARTHHYNHNTYGARYEDGMDIEGLTDGGTTYTQTTSGHFWDEDIRHDISAQSTHKFLYKLGNDGEWTNSSADSNVCFKNGGSYGVWNENNGGVWQLTQGTSTTDFVIYFYIATPNITNYTIYKLIGQNAYSTRSAARAAIESEMRNITTEGLPSPEFIFLYATIVKRDGTLVALADDSLYYDLRYIRGGSGGSGNAASYALDIITDVTDFNTHLSSSDTNVQLALDTLDDHTHTASQVTDFDTEVANNTTVVANTNARHTQGSDTTLGTMTANINMNTHKLTSLSAPSANGDSIRATTKITETLLESATDLKHTQGTDTSLGSGAVAADHGTASTDQIINVCYGTSDTPPTASTTTIGTLYIKYTA